MIIEELDIASYKGAEWFATKFFWIGGRRTSKKLIANSDRQVVEDFGLQVPTFKVEGYVAARRDNTGQELLSYKEVRDTLRKAFNEGGNGTFVHSFEGKIENVKCIEFTIIEETTSVGLSKVAVTFEISNADGVPRQVSNTITEVIAQNEVLQTAIYNDMVEKYNLSPSSLGNFDEASAKLTEFLEMVDDATSPITAAGNALNEFSAFIADSTADVVGLVQTPETFADTVISAIGAIKGVYTATTGALAAVMNLFTFGDNDNFITESTFALLERKTNNDVTNVAVKSSALGYAYELAVQVDYFQVDEINAIQEELEDQYKSVIDSNLLGIEAFAELETLRTAAQNAFEDKKVNAKTIIDITSSPISGYSLSYQYYGTTEFGEDLAMLNGYVDLAFMQGELKVFTA